MLISENGGWRSLIAQWVPWWLANRVEDGLDVGWRIFWTIAATLDGMYQVALEGTYAAWPGFGTPTALEAIGRSRGMIRGMKESDASYSSRLRSWLTRWQHAGSAFNLAQGIRDYVLGQPKIQVINRAGKRVTINANGTTATDSITWNWDSLSNPERAGYWSELWIIVFAPPWPIDALTLPDWQWGQSDPGYGHLVPRVDVDAIKGLLERGPSQHAAHSYVRCVIWSYDSSLFDPATPATMPDGTWGMWGYSATPGAAMHRSGRFTSCRYWEPERDPNVA